MSTRGDITDVPGILVGHATRDTDGHLTGCTVVLAEPACTGGVDVRGGGPGTRETDLLDPRNVVDRVDAVVLSGGSAFGLRAADGVMDALLADGRGWVIDPDDAVVPTSPSHRVPIVPAAILFDLGRGEAWTNHPTAADGARAYAAARASGVGTALGTTLAQGRVGAGTGARVAAGTQPGGVGSASVALGDGLVVGAIVAVNAVGVPTPWLVAELGAPAYALPQPPDQPAAGQATTIGVVATNATLTKAECAKLAGIAHDGLARAISPVHTAFDGDTFFALATGRLPAPDPLTTLAIQQGAAHAVSQAIANALRASATG